MNEQICEEIGNSGQHIVLFGNWLRKNGANVAWSAEDKITVTYDQVFELVRQVAVATVAEERERRDDPNFPRGWIVWDGIGEHPTGDTQVYYRMYDGDTCDDVPSLAQDLDWTRNPKSRDWEITAYKVVE